MNITGPRPTQRQIYALYAIREERPDDADDAMLRRLRDRGWATDHTGLWELTIDGEALLQ